MLMLLSQDFLRICACVSRNARNHNRRNAPLALRQCGRLMPTSSNPTPPLVDSRSSFPIQNVDQRPSILIKLDLQLPLLVHGKLG